MILLALAPLSALAADPPPPRPPPLAEYHPIPTDPRRDAGIGMLVAGVMMIGAGMGTAAIVAAADHDGFVGWGRAMRSPVLVPCVVGLTFSSVGVGTILDARHQRRRERKAHPSDA
jgi:hypothetical protein